MSESDGRDELFRTALHERADTMLADVHASPGRLLDGIRQRQRRRNRVTAAVGGVAVAAGIAGAVVLVRPSGNSAQPLAPSTSSTTQGTTSGAPLPGPTVSAPSVVAVPDVVGMTVAQATAILDQLRLQIDVADFGKGDVVLSQLPAAGSRVLGGSHVQVAVGVAESGRTPIAPEPSGSGAPPLAASGATFGPAPAGTCGVAPTATRPAGGDTFLALTACGIEAYDESGAFYGYLQGDGVGTSAQAVEMATNEGGELYLFREDSKGLLGRTLYRWSHGAVVRVGGDLGAVSSDAPTSGRLVPQHLTAAGPYVAWSRDVPADPEVTVDIRVLDTRTGAIRTIPVSREPFATSSIAVGGLDLRPDGALAVELTESHGVVDANASPAGEIRIVEPGSTSLSLGKISDGGCPFNGPVRWQGDDVAATTSACGKVTGGFGFVVARATGGLVSRVAARGELAAARRGGGYLLTGTDVNNPAAMAIADDAGNPLFTQVLVGAKGAEASDVSPGVFAVAPWGFAIG